MKLAVRFQTLLTVALAAAVLVPIALISFLHYWDNRSEAEAAREQAYSHAQLVARLIERELTQANAAFATALPTVGVPSRQRLMQVLETPRVRQVFRALYVTDLAGSVQWYYSGTGQIHRREWALPQQLAGEGQVLVALPEAGRLDLPVLAVAARLPATAGSVLVAEIRPEAVRELLQEYESATGFAVRLTAGGPPDPDLPGQATVGGLPLEVYAGLAQSDQENARRQHLWLTLALGALSVAVSAVLARSVAEPMIRPFVTSLKASEDRIRQLTHRLGESHETLVEVSQQRSVDLGYSRATLYAVMESLNDGLVLITPDNRIRYMNRHTDELLQLSEAFFPGRPAEELYDAVAAVCADPEVARQQLSGSTVLTVGSDSRAPRYLRWQTFLIRNATGANLGLGHLLTDVTQEREIDRVKSELISTVSHELRTPLTAIRASASSLLRPNVEWDEETRSDFLLTISEESRHLQELIENLLDMSKIEAGVLRLETYPVDIGDLVDGVAARARLLYPDLLLSQILPPGLPAVNVDRRRMEQVFLNLLDNAVKYGAASRVVELRAWHKDQEVWFTVRDEGIGIPPEHLPLLFQRFHRVDSRLTRDTGGSGLGLAICRGIVEAHGGRIWAESELSKGSSFFIALPVAREEADHDETEGVGSGG